MSVDKEAMRRDYEAGMALRAIALKYGCSHAVVCKYAKKNGWERNPCDRVNEMATAVTTPLDVSAEHKTVRDYTYRLLDRVGKALDDPKPINARDLRSIASTLLDVRQLLNALSPLEAEEQRLRIEGLRKQTEEGLNQYANVVVQFVDTEGAEE